MKRCLPAPTKAQGQDGVGTPSLTGSVGWSAQQAHRDSITQGEKPWLAAGLGGSWLEEVTPKPSPTLIASESLTTPQLSLGRGRKGCSPLHMSFPSLFPFVTKNKHPLLSLVTTQLWVAGEGDWYCCHHGNSRQPVSAGGMWTLNLFSLVPTQPARDLRSKCLPPPPAQGSQKSQPPHSPTFPPPPTQSLPSRQHSVSFGAAEPGSPSSLQESRGAWPL